MLKWEIVLHWLGVACYAASAVLFMYSMAFKKPGAISWAVRLAALGMIPHSAALGLRWLETGHGPYMRRYEVFSSDVWVGVLMFLIAQHLRPNFKQLGVVVMPVSFLVIGAAVMSSPEIREIPSSYKTFWLILHILFAKMAYGSAMIGTALSGFYLLRKRQEAKGKVAAFFKHLPSPEAMDEWAYAINGFGFINIAIMILAGSIWAQNAWGSYWTWDRIETWSLVSWFLYGLYLHLRRIHGWKGDRAAWFALGAFAVLLFALFGVGVLWESAHSPYLG